MSADRVRSIFVTATVKSAVAMRCASCGHANERAGRFCANCGLRLGARCPHCAAANAGDAKACVACGGALASATPRLPVGERRQLTVLFCDLVGSTELAGSMDPEDWSEIATAYQRAAARAVEQFGGHVAKLLGDGLVVYFGWPYAHDDDAERAVRGGLAIIDALALLNRQVAPTRNVRLAARIGIDTGLVVVGESAGADAEVFGDTPNVAARVEALARPDAVFITAATHRLVAGLFEVEDTGAHRLKGVTAPIRVFDVRRPSGMRRRLDVAAAGLTPFVGRDAEREVLQRRWEGARGGQGQILLVEGEPGIGKSRLVQMLKETLASEPHTWIECVGSPYHQNSPFFPIIDTLQRWLASRGDESADARVARLSAALAFAGIDVATALPLIAPLLTLPLPDDVPPLVLSPEGRRRDLLRCLAAWVVGMARVQPTVVVVEDLQWVDASTLELLAMCNEQAAHAAVLLLYTARSGFRAPWPASPTYGHLVLDRLDRRLVRTMVSRAASRAPLSAAMLETVVARSDGIPLFAEELTRLLVEGGTGPVADTIPTTLRDSLMARLDRLGPAKEVAQRAAVLGRQFPYALLAATSRVEPAVLDGALARLVEAELLFQRGTAPAATYTFKHALIQEAAYQSLLLRARQQLHARVAEALREQFPTDVEATPELLARHYEMAGLVAEAVDQYRLAGAQAVGRSAHEEAVGHLRRGIALLEQLPPDAERDGREIALQLVFGASLIAARGWGHPETGSAYDRVRVLSESVGDVGQRAAALVGLTLFHSTRGAPQRGVELAQNLLVLAGQTGDRDHLLLAHVHLAIAEFYQGKFSSSLRHCEAAAAIYDPEVHRRTALKYGSDQLVMVLAVGARCLWQLGYPDRALERIHHAVGFARTLDHPFTLASALFWESLVHWIRRDPADQQVRAAEEVIALSETQSFPFWIGLAKAFRGAAIAQAGGGAGAVLEVSAGLGMAGGTGAQAGVPALLALLAEAHYAVGQPDQAMPIVKMALAISAETGQPLWDAELHRLEGELLLSLSGDDTATAEALFRRAAAIARDQEARSLELRAARSLAQLLQSTGRSEEARAVLAPVHAWFEEGFGTRDLVDATTLLAGLAPHRSDPTAARHARAS